jgi:hypothetical protein
MPNDRILVATLPRTLKATERGDTRTVRYVAKGNILVNERDRALRMTAEEARQRIYALQMDYLAWTFEEEVVDAK